MGRLWHGGETVYAGVGGRCSAPSWQSCSCETRHCREFNRQKALRVGDRSVRLASRTSV